MTRSRAARRPSRLLAAAVPVALLASAAVVSSSTPSAAGSSLQAWFVQPVRSVLVTALPVEVPVALRSVPEDVGAELTPTRYSLQLPGEVVVQDVRPVRDEAPPGSTERGRTSETAPTWSSSASLVLPAGTPCGSYPLLARQSNDHLRTDLNTAVGWVQVLGCPRELEVVPADEVLTGGPVPFTFRARYLSPDGAAPGARREARALRLLVDGSPVGPDLPPEEAFHRRHELALGCGAHRVELVTDRGVLLEERSVRLRCPTVTPAVDEVERTALPREVPVLLADFAAGLAYEVRLDGVPVAEGTTGPAGEGSSAVVLPERAACGPHDLTVRQLLPPVPTVPPYEEPVPAAPPPPPEGPEPPPVREPDDQDSDPDPDSEPDSEPQSEPQSEPEPEPRPRRGAVLVPATVEESSAPVLRAAVRRLPEPTRPSALEPSVSQPSVPEPSVLEPPASSPPLAPAAEPRTAQVTVPLTVRCPGTPSLDVTPAVRADDGTAARYELTGTGFGDDLAVTLTAGDEALPLPPVRTDGLGRLSEAVRLRLPCGPVTFAAVDASGRRATDVVQVRCPALRLDPDTVDRGALPVDVPGTGSGFDGDVPLDVLLDGVDVGDTRTDPAGGAPVVVPAAADLRCGVHRVALRQRGPAPTPAAEAALTVVCPPAGTPLLQVTPDVVAHGQIATVTAEDLPPDRVRLVWRLRDGTQRGALPRTVLPQDGRLRLQLLVMDGERTGPRRLLAMTDGGLVVADVDVTLVVVSPFQPGRRTPDRRTGLLGRR